MDLRAVICGEGREPLGDKLTGTYEELGFAAEASKVECCTDPNRHAPAATLEWQAGKAIVHGYQDFSITRDRILALPGNPLHVRKAELLGEFLGPSACRNRNLLGLGANAGFFSFQALLNGVEMATAVDMDQEYLAIMEKIRDGLGFSNLRITPGNVTDCTETADIVLALGLVHWLYSCTAMYGSLDLLVAWLAERTNYVLIVEWIEPDDPNIAFFGHTDWNKEAVKEPYTLAAFEAALSRWFVRVQPIGEVSPTRRLYAAFRVRHIIDLSGPLPFLMGKERIVSCRNLTAWDGVEYWSCVYDSGDAIVKQASLGLAQREDAFLRGLDSPYFPRVLSSSYDESFSVVEIEKIEGFLLSDKPAADIGTATEFAVFVGHCLSILEALAAQGIVHRDIRADNLLVRNGQPVLIDFGWAVSPEFPLFGPSMCGGSGRPPDGSFCDVYSMGKVLEEVNGGRFPEFGAVIALMTNGDNNLRVTDIGVLRTLFAMMAVHGDDGQEVEPSYTMSASGATITLLEQIARRDQVIEQLTRVAERPCLMPSAAAEPTAPEVGASGRSTERSANTMCSMAGQRVAHMRQSAMIGRRGVVTRITMILEEGPCEQDRNN